MYNLLEYSKNYLKTSGSNKNVINSKCFKYETSITRAGIDYNVAENIANRDGDEVDNPAYDNKKIGKKEVKILVPLKYLSNFWSTLDIPFINCKVPLTLIWSANSVITSM